MIERPKFNLTREEALKLILKMADNGDQFWVNLTQEFYDQATNTMPTIYDVLKPLDVSKEEITRCKK